MLVERFDKQCDSGMYTLIYHLFEQMVEDICVFESLSVLDINPYERFDLNVKQGYIKTSLTRRTRMMEDVKGDRDELRTVAVIREER